VFLIIVLFKIKKGLQKPASLSNIFSAQFYAIVPFHWYDGDDEKRYVRFVFSLLLQKCYFFIKYQPITEFLTECLIGKFDYAPARTTDVVLSGGDFSRLSRILWVNI